LIKIICGRAAQFLLTLAMIRVATSILSPKEMGKVSLVVATTALFSLFLVSPVGMFINRRLHAWQGSGAARQYLQRYALYLLLAAILAALCVGCFYLFGLANFGLSIAWLMLLVAGSLFFNSINLTAIPSLNLLGDSGRFMLLTVATMLASFCFATLLVKAGQPLAQYWLLGLIIGQALLGLIGTQVLFGRLRAGAPRSAARSMSASQLQALFSFAWPVTIAAGFGWVQAQGYRYLVEDRLGLTQLGLFVAGYGVSSGILAGLESVLTAYFQPRLYRDVSAADSEHKGLVWRRYAAAVMPSMLLTVMAIVALAPELTRIFLGASFQSAAKYVVWGALAEAARLLIAVYSLIAHVYMRTQLLIVPNVLGALFSISLCLWFIPRFGTSGVGMGAGGIRSHGAADDAPVVGQICSRRTAEPAHHRRRPRSRDAVGRDAEPAPFSGLVRLGPVYHRPVGSGHRLCWTAVPVSPPTRRHEC
jgi:O-antigen/teichoic acid export membrane protein